jgi:hypothetical protein
MKPAKTYCYTMTGKYAMSLSKELLLLRASQQTAVVARQLPANCNTGKVFSMGPCRAVISRTVVRSRRRRRRRRRSSSSSSRRRSREVVAAAECLLVKNCYS